MANFSTLPAGSAAGPDDSLPLTPALLQELRKALGAIRYGSIELVIHDGRVVQLERRQKIRFEPDVSERSK
ncbi:MAG TPA: YezD family protein [Gemmatimonadales bacterium]|jgi:hypothetical protein